MILIIIYPRRLVYVSPICLRYKGLLKPINVRPSFICCFDCWPLDSLSHLRDKELRICWRCEHQPSSVFDIQNLKLCVRFHVITSLHQSFILWTNSLNQSIFTKESFLVETSPNLPRKGVSKVKIVRKNLLGTQHDCF